MRHVRAWLTLAFSSLLVLSRTAGGSGACPGTAAEIVGGGDIERAAICSSAAFAERFFGDCGIAPKQPYKIEIVADVKNSYGVSVFGRFYPSRRSILLVPYLVSVHLVRSIPADDPLSAYARLPPMAYYQSLAAHEISHSIVHQNLRVAPSLAIYEYVAAVLQFSSLEAVVRDELLGHFHHRRGFRVEMFNDILLAMDPAGYGAAAYWHFSSPGNGCRFFRQLLSEEGILPRVGN